MYLDGCNHVLRGLGDLAMMMIATAVYISVAALYKKMAVFSVTYLIVFVVVGAVRFARSVAPNS